MEESPTSVDSRSNRSQIGEIVSLAIGALLFGYLGSWVGQQLGTEMATVICYAVGFIGGSILGVLVFRSFQSKKSSDEN